MKARMRIRAKIWWVGAWLLVLGGSGVGAPTVELELNSYITNWLILGPFPNRVVEGELGGTNRLGLFTDYLTEIGGEAEAKLARGVRVTGWGRVEATNITSVTPEIDLDGVYGMLDLGVGYAFVNVRVRREVEAYLHVGSDDGVRVWLDGKLVIDMPGERGYLADENWARVQLRRGRHRLLVKVDDAFGAWKFGLRFVDEAVHRELIARQIRKELRVELEGEMREGEALRVRLDTEPSLTDFVARVVGRWVSGDGAITQGFVVGLGEFVELPKGYERAEKVRLEAWTEGIPGREVRRVVNIYGGPISVVASGLAVRAANVLEGLTRTDVTARLAQRHEGIIKLNLEEAWEWGARGEGKTSVEVYQALTDVEEILRALERGEDYLGGITGTYRVAYVSAVDGSVQPFLVTMPASAVAGVLMPMVVVLHEAGEDFSGEFERVRELSACLVVRVHGRGRAGGYVGLSALDVLEVVGYMTNFYAVDGDRIYLVGSGMGAYGVWMLGARRPELWGGVVAMGGYTADVPLINLRNVAVRVVHGDRDLMTPVVYSRAAVEYLVTRCCPVVYDEMRDAGYRLQGVAESLRLFGWLLNHRRESDPREVEIRGMYTWNEGGHWLKIRRRRSEKSGARAHGRFVGANELVLYLDNVAEVEVELPARYVDDESLLTVICNGRNYEMSAPLPPRIYVRYDGARAILQRTAEEQPTERRAYRMGSWQQFYDGEPVLVVRGTGGGAEMTAALASCAEVVRKWSFPGRVMSRGGFRVKDDHEVTQEDLERYNVILLGGPRENKVTARMAERLGAPLGEGHVVIGGNEETLKGRGMWLCQVNPLAPRRLVWIWASPEVSFYDANAAWIQDWMFPAVNPPDLLVLQCSPQRYVRALHFDEEWKLDAEELGSPQLSEVVRPPEFLARVFVRTLQTLTQSDYVWVSEQFRPLVQQMLRLRAAEAATLLLRHSTVFVCEIQGRDLRDLHARVAGKVDGPQLLPAVFDVEEERTYKIAVTPRGLRSLNEAAKGALQGATYHEVAIRRAFRSLIEESLAF